MFNWSKDDIALFETYVAGVKGALPGDTEALFTLRGLRAVEDLVAQRMALQREGLRPINTISPVLERCLEAGRAEVRRDQEIHPAWPSDPLHALAILGKEFGELTQAMVQYTYERDKISSPAVVAEKALQTAAMALRLMLHLDDYRYIQMIGIPWMDPTDREVRG